MANDKSISIRWRVAAGLAAVLAIAPVAASGAAAASQPARVLPVQSSAGGASYGEWAARWWQWALSAPVSDNPVLDATGADCAVGQTGQVWFLAGTFGGSATRSCTIPTGQKLFFPIVNFASIATEPDETAELVHSKVTARADNVNTALLTAEVDGTAVPNLERYRAHSPTFDVTLPEGNIFGAPAGVYGPAATDGYWLMLAPLGPGSHTVHFGGVTPTGVTIDVTYNILVEHP